MLRVAAYGLRPLVDVKPIRLINNAVFDVKVEGGGRFVLRVHRRGYRSFGNIRSELRFLEALGDELCATQIAAPRPIAAPSGSSSFASTDARATC